MTQFKKDIAMGYAAKAGNTAAEARQTLHECIQYTLGYAHETMDLNVVALLLTNVNRKVPTLAKDLADWAALYFPLQINVDGNEYRCKAVKVRRGEYNYHQNDANWQFAEAAAKPFWIKVKPPKTEKGIDCRAELVKLLRKFGSDKRVNNDDVTPIAAKDANEFATIIEQRIAKASLAAANAEAEARAAKAAANKLEEQATKDAAKMAELEAKLAAAELELAAATAPKAATTKAQAKRKVKAVA